MQHSTGSRSRFRGVFAGHPRIPAAAPRRRVGLVLLAGLLVLGPAGQTAAASMLAPAFADDLEALKEQADEAREELEAANEEYTDREAALEEAQEDLQDTLHELQRTEIRLSELREPLVELASTLYKQPEAGVMGVLTSESLGTDLEVEVYVHKLAEDREEVLEEANALYGEQGALASSAQELQSHTQLERIELEEDLEALQDLSEESSEALYAELEARGLSVEAYRAGLECDPSQASAANGAPNGLLPEEALCEVQDGHLLRADAAVDFIQLNERYVQEFGEDMCITSAYRDLPNQHRVYAERPGFAAVPGTSNHGMGEAIDFCGGVQNFRSERWNWVEANGGEFGWFHPDWAKSSPFEPWHWEYTSPG